jgi:hypothetical protein
MVPLGITFEWDFIPNRVRPHNSSGEKSILVGISINAIVKMVPVGVLFE